MSVFAQRNGTSATGASLILGGTFSLEQAAIINLELEIRSQVQLTCTETEFKKLSFYTWCIETEFIELGFCTWKPSSLNSISILSPHQFLLNRVH